MSAPEAERLIGVWDVRDAQNVWRRHVNRGIEWAARLFPDVANSTYRAEFYRADPPFAILYCYRLDDQGRRYMDPATGTAAVGEPFKRPLKRLPPLSLLRVR